MNGKYSQLIGSLLLLLTAFIWGSAFVAQRVGMDHLGPCGYNGVRCLIATLAMIPCIALLDLLQGARPSLFGKAQSKEARKTLLLGGLCCGVCLGFSSLLQQWGIKYTSVGKASFLTAIYIVIVPLLGMFFRKRTSLIVWFCALIALFGAYLLCYKPGEAFNVGDLLVLCCALLFSCHILVIDHFAPRVDCIRLSLLQFFVSGIISLAIAAFTETLTWQAVLLSWKPLCYAAFLSSAVAYTLQIIAQKSVPPAVATLLMSLESVFGAVSGWIFLGETLNSKELCGCVLIFIAVLLAQLSSLKTAAPDQPQAGV